MTESQNIVNAFGKAINLKFTNVVYKRQLGQANILLNTYSYDEIISVIDYLGRKGWKKPISSLGFLPYIMNEILQQISQDEIKKKLNTAVKIEQIEFDVDLAETNKKKVADNKFATRGMVSF